MKIIRTLNSESILEVEIPSDTVWFNLISWEDGDGFFDICEEDGGIDSRQRHYFNLKDKSIKTNIARLKKLLEVYVNLKSFSSKNGMYKLGYDIYISFGKYLIAFCPELDTGYLAELNFIERFVGCIKQKEPWDSQKFKYWEKR